MLCLMCLMYCAGHQCWIRKEQEFVCVSVYRYKAWALSVDVERTSTGEKCLAKEQAFSRDKLHIGPHCRRLQGHNNNKNKQNEGQDQPQTDRQASQRHPNRLSEPRGPSAAGSARQKKKKKSENSEKRQ